MNLKRELEKIHSTIARANGPVNHMLVKRKYWKSNVEKSLTLLESATKQLKELRENISKARD